MQISRKQKTLSQFLFAFPKSTFNFEKFQKKDDPYNWCIFELRYSKNGG